MSPRLLLPALLLQVAATAAQGPRRLFAQMRKDPHLHLPHGGRANFRGKDKTVFEAMQQFQQGCMQVAPVAVQRQQQRPSTDPKARRFPLPPTGQHGYYWWRFIPGSPLCI